MDLISASLHGLNIILGLALVVLYVQNYRQLRSKYTIGLLLFALLLVLHSAMGLYFDASMVMYSNTAAEQAATVLEGLKAVSFAVLLWISWE